jgi:hypothetical protein
VLLLDPFNNVIVAAAAAAAVVVVVVVGYRCASARESVIRVRV